jgi:peptide/nickel transport system ATP-binding protein
VMYAGQIAESGPIEEVLADPRHPYTQLLVSAVPDPRAPLSVAAEADQGDPPKVIDPGPGCRFRFRCPLAIEVCATTTPQLSAAGAGETGAGERGAGEPGSGRQVACHVAQSGAEVKAFI